MLEDLRRLHAEVGDLIARLERIAPILYAHNGHASRSAPEGPLGDGEAEPALTRSVEPRTPPGPENPEESASEPLRAEPERADPLRTCEGCGVAFRAAKRGGGLSQRFCSGACRKRFRRRASQDAPEAAPAPASLPEALAQGSERGQASPSPAPIRPGDIFGPRSRDRPPAVPFTPEYRVRPPAPPIRGPRGEPPADDGGLLGPPRIDTGELHPPSGWPGQIAPEQAPAAMLRAETEGRL